MESPGISDTEIHRIKLPKPFLSQILLTSQLGLYLGRLSESDAEDFERGFRRLLLVEFCLLEVRESLSVLYLQPARCAGWKGTGRRSPGALDAID